MTRPKLDSDLGKFLILLIHRHLSRNLTTWPVEANKLAFSASSRGAMLADALLAFVFTALPFPWPLAFGSAAFFFGLISELIQNLLLIRRRTL